MSRYGQYGQYYDPVGSQANHPSGYTYQAPSTASSEYQNATSSSGYTPAYPSHGTNSYGAQHYASNGNAQARSNSNANHAAAALSSLSNQNYNQVSSTSTGASTSQYDSSYCYNATNNSNTPGSSNIAAQTRAQNSASPLYQGSQTSSATFGHLSIPEASQASSNGLGSASAYQNAPLSKTPSEMRYSNAYTPQQGQKQQQPQIQPQRYNSPVQAVQAQQQRHNRQSSHNANQPSPHMVQAVRTAHQDATRRQSGSAEPTPTTVNPSQVYDNRAELQRKAAIEAERRKKYDAEQAAKAAEEERAEAAKREAEQKVEQETVAKQAEKERKAEQRRKAREEKKQSKSAATTLQQLATGSSDSASAQTNVTDDEAGIRAVFEKMREYNARNPAMLAKLWEEERKSHSASTSQATIGKPATSGRSTAQQKASDLITAAKSSSAPANVLSPLPGFISRAAQGTTSSEVAQTTISEAQNASQASNMQATRPVPTQAASQLWPQNKKGAVAASTAKWLIAQPGNEGKHVSPDEVMKILDTNPHYVQLCEALEEAGIQFQRAALARELLKTVPDAAKQSPASATSKPIDVRRNTGFPASSSIAARNNTKDGSGPTAGQPQQAVPASWSNTATYESPSSLSNSARETNNMGKLAFQANGTNGAHVSSSRRSPVFTQGSSQTVSSRQGGHSQQPEIKPETKPTEPRRPPADKEAAARKRTFNDLIDLTAEDSDEEGPPAKILQPPNGPITVVNTQQNSNNAFLHKPMSFNNIMYAGLTNQKYGQVAQPGSVRPSQTMASMNALGQPQLGATPRPAHVRKGPSPEQLQQTRIKGKMLVEPIMRDRVARKSKYDSRTIARDVLLATGRHPDMRALNAHLMITQKLLGQHGGETDIDGRGNRSDLSTIRWDIIDPDPPKEDAAKTAQNVNGSGGTEVDVEMKDEGEHEVDNTLDAPTEGLPQPKLRGRPSKAHKASLPGTLLTNNLGENNLDTPASRDSSRPHTPLSTHVANSIEMSAGGAIGYSQFSSALGPDGKKKKGRPFGWRKSIHSREAQGLPPITHPSKAAGTLNRTKQTQQAPEPKYQIYACKWEKCKAELHNLDNLKKHILKVHEKKSNDGVWECAWQGCDDGGFADMGEWMGHIDKAHLQPIAWKLGDGPRDGESTLCSPHREQLSCISLTNALTLRALTDNG